MCYLVLTTWILFTLTAELVACAHGGGECRVCVHFFSGAKGNLLTNYAQLIQIPFFYYIIKKKENETPGSFKALT